MIDRQYFLWCTRKKKNTLICMIYVSLILLKSLTIWQLKSVKLACVQLVCIALHFDHDFFSENSFLHFSYAGLHCVVIKGYSKSAGYQPGVKFEDNRFRNSWNAVYVAGAWRFVQCNWGARHLVNAKEVPKPGKAKSDSLRYFTLLIILQH